MDLLANPDSRRVFDVRFKTVASMRQTFTDEGFVEVETPILQSLAGGAIARPFVTHSNALDIDLSLRIAPELFLKRLVVGGYERVFEIARNFRNEGIDTRHSPEFTLLEAYRAFGDVHDGMDLTERAIVAAAARRCGSPHLHRGRPQGGPHPALAPARAARSGRGGCGPAGAPERPGGGGACRLRCARGRISGLVGIGQAHLRAVRQNPPTPHRRTRGSSAASRWRSARSPVTGSDDPTLADRFELVIDGQELANGYSELNVPEEQETRFAAEAVTAATGDPEAHPADRAFVRALEYGLPPTSGIGIGLDRLVMLLAEVTSIRDVILFPILRPQTSE